MKSLYRRYRPLKLTDVVGQSQVTDPLVKSLKQGKINHAYLFIGPRGCGKTSVARILAHEVNGFRYDIEDEYIDIIEIDGASNRGIDNIRDLREKVAIAPSSGKYKVYIIDEVHMLTKEAFNALLKTLEEPPKHVIFIMATTDAYKVPVTITSRAQSFTFKLADRQVMFDYLKTITDKEKIKITDEALSIIVKRGGGSFRDTLSLLDQLSSLSEDEITKEMVTDALGLPEDEAINSLITAYESGETKKVFSIIKNSLSTGVKADTLASELIASIIDSPKPSLMELLAKLPDVKAPYAEAKLLVALSRPGSRVSPATIATGTTTTTGTATSTATTTVTTRTTTTGTTTATINAPKVQAPTHPTAKQPTTDIDFNWGRLLEMAQEKSDAIHSQLLKSKHSFDGEVLHIYPNKKIAKNILERDNNKKILQDLIPSGVKITIHDISDSPNNGKKDAVLSRLSDIMGGEVSNDGGGNPF